MEPAQPSAVRVFRTDFPPQLARVPLPAPPSEGAEYPSASVTGRAAHFVNPPTQSGLGNGLIIQETPWN
jgi:hypothetical protein